MVPQTNPFLPTITNEGAAVHQAAMQRAQSLMPYIHNEHKALLSDMYSLDCQQAGAVLVPTASQVNTMNLLHQLALVEPRGQGYILTLLGKAVLAVHLHLNILLLA